MLTIHFRDNDIIIKAEKGISIIDAANLNPNLELNNKLAARINNRLRELNYKLYEDCSIDLIDTSDEDGVRIYMRSLCFIFVDACHRLFPECSVRIEHSLCRGLYCEVKKAVPLKLDEIDAINIKMKEIVEEDLPFDRMTISRDEADRLNETQGYAGKNDILKYRPDETCHVYSNGNMTNYFYGYMVPSTGYIKVFDAKYYPPGIILRFPRMNTNGELPEFVDSPKIFNVFHSSEKWADLIGVGEVADLNKKIEKEESGELIRICEGLHEKNISNIADIISDNNEQLRLILIAGPSSSGKTTFAKRLSVQLKVNGINPISISIDNYYLNREDIPIDENGNQDFETIDALDLERFNRDILKLINGEKVEMPVFNFVEGKREEKGIELICVSGQPIIVEGIHGLNEKLSHMIPRSYKYEIYLSALTQLNLDIHNRISTSDSRLIRRIVRDHRTRGADIETTMKMWSMVRKGEEKYIYPYQENADIMFNSSLIYELSVLKPLILPHLNKIGREHELFIEANRLIKFLKYFIDLEPDDIPQNSILREFTGGSCFY